MITTCSICGCEIELPNDEFMTVDQVIEENTEQICDKCAELIEEFIIRRN